MINNQGWLAGLVGVLHSPYTYIFLFATSDKSVAVKIAQNLATIDLLCWLIGRCSFHCYGNNSYGMHGPIENLIWHYTVALLLCSHLCVRS